jgi:hypothetical protein
MGRHPKSRLDLLHPNLGITLQQRQEKQKKDHDQRVHKRSFSKGEWVLQRTMGEDRVEYEE